MNKPAGRSGAHDSILNEIREAVASLRFGDVVIKVHAGKIIQIEVTEKKRFDEIWKVGEGGGI